MRCSKCNREMDASTNTCHYCDEVEAERVRVLTPDERSRYHGVTIDTGADGETRDAGWQRASGKTNSGFYIKQVNLGGGGWLSKLVIWAVIAAIAAFVLFVALPVALIGIGIGVLVWIVLSFFKR